MPTVSILKVGDMSSRIADDLTRLLRQVRRDTNILVSAAEWRGIIRQANIRIFIIRLAGRVVAMAILRWHQLPGRKVAFVDDVVVDVAYRRKGLGTKLLKTIKNWGGSHHLRHVDFTSGRDRKAGLAFYLALGWRRRDTTVYRLSL